MPKPSLRVPVPGQTVPLGALVTPGGEQGVSGVSGTSGINAYTATAVGDFTVPDYGLTVNITVVEGSWIIPGQMLWFAGAGEGGAAGQLRCTARTGNNLTLLNVEVPPSGGGALPPLADATQDGLLRQTTDSIRDLVDGTNNYREIEVASTYRKRYYYSWHCDHPPLTEQIGGTGGAVTMVAPQASHPGIYRLGTGATQYNSAYYRSNAIPDFQLSHFTKLALRMVWYNATNFFTPTQKGGIWMGFADTVDFPLGGGVGITNGWGVKLDDLTIGLGVGGGIFQSFNAGVMAGGLSIPNLSGKWNDIAIYWDATTGMHILYNGILGTPITDTNAMPLNTNLFWLLQVSNGQDYAGGPLVADEANPRAVDQYVLIDSVEICGEYADPNVIDFRGEELITAF